MHLTEDALFSYDSHIQQKRYDGPSKYRLSLSSGESHPSAHPSFTHIDIKSSPIFTLTTEQPVCHLDPLSCSLNFDPVEKIHLKTNRLYA